jgi:hypothetical protein
MEGRWVIRILVGPVLEQERAGGGGALGGEEAHFIEETCTQGLYTCGLMTVGVTVGGPSKKVVRGYWSLVINAFSDLYWVRVCRRKRGGFWEVGV